MGRQSLNIVGDTAWLSVVDLRDLLHARRWTLVNDQSEIIADLGRRAIHAALVAALHVRN